MPNDPEVEVIYEGKRIPVLKSNLKKALSIKGTTLAPPKDAEPLPERQSVSAEDDMVEVVRDGKKYMILQPNLDKALSIPGTRLAAPVPPWLMGMGNHFLEGMTSGFGAESSGLATTLPLNMAGLDTGTMRRDVERKAHASNEAFREENPWMAGIANIAGGIAPTIGTGGLNLAMKIPALAERAAVEGSKRTLKEGAKEYGKARVRAGIDALPFAGISGFGSTEGDFKERLAGAGKSMMYGAPLAAGITGVLSPAAAGARWLKDKVKPGTFIGPYYHQFKDFITGGNAAPPLPHGSPADIMPPAPPAAPPVASPQVRPNLGMSGGGGPLRPPLAGPPVAIPPAPASAGRSPLRPPLAQPAPGSMPPAPRPPRPVTTPPLQSNPVPPAPAPAGAPPATPPPISPMVAPAQGSPRYIAEQQVLEAIRKSGLTLEQIQERAREAARLGYRDISLTDLLAESGNAMMRKAKGAFLKSGENQNQLSQGLRDRQAGAGPRIRQATNQALNATRPAHEVIAELEQNALNRSRPHYAAAFEAHPQVTDPEILGLMRLDGPREAYEVAQRAARNNPRNPTVIPDIFDAEGNVANPPSLQSLDIVKKVLWNQITNLRKRREPAVLHADIAPMEEAHAMLTDAMKRISGRYDRALSEYRGPQQLREALEAGQNLFKGQPHEIEQTVHDLATQAERDSFLLGVADAINNKIGGAGMTEDVHKLLAKTPKMQELLRAAFPSEEAYNAFVGRLNIEHNQTRVNQWMHGGSPTVENQEAVAGLSDGWGKAFKQAASGLSLKPLAAQGMDTLSRAIPAAVAEEINPLTLGPIWRSLPRLQAADAAARRAAEAAAARRIATRPVQSNRIGGITGLITPK